MKKVKLENIAVVSAGQGAPQGDHSFGNDGIPFVKAGNLEDLINTNDEYETCKLVNKETAKKYKLKIYPKGTILFAKSGMSATKGRIYCLMNDSYVVNHLSTITPNSKLVETRFLKYFFNVFPPSRLIKDESYPSISLGDINRMEVSLLPLEDQKRIVKILDEADALRQKRKQAIGLLDDYLKSVFLKLTKEEKVEKINLLNLFNVTTGKLNSNAAEKDGIYPFYTCSRDDCFKINKYAFDCEALILSGNNANAEYSVKHYSGKFNAYQRTYILTLKKEYSYLYFKMALENKLKLLQKSSIGSNTKYLTMGIFKRIDFEVPKIEVQRKYEILAKKVEVTKQKMTTQFQRLENQFQALMQKAFKGEL